MLNLSTVLSTFGLVFIAELGDKTQLAAFTLASSSRRPFIIFAASSAAFFLSSIMAAFLGKTVAVYGSSWSSWLAGSLFLVFGLVVLLAKEPAAVQSAFFAAAKAESGGAKEALKFLNKTGLLNQTLKEALSEEHVHKELFDLFLKRRALFKDNINENEEALNVLVGKLSLRVNLLKVSVDEALDELIRLEQAAVDCYGYILDHLQNNQEHKNDPMIHILTEMVEDEIRHKELYTELRARQSVL